MMASRILSRSFKQLNISAFRAANSAKKVTCNVLSIASINPAISRGFGASAIQLQQSKGYKGLVEILENEIKEEKQIAKKEELPKIKGFEFKTEGPNVTLTRTFEDEKITIKFSVNSSLYASEEPTPEELENERSEPKANEFKSRPPFTVTIKRGTQNLSLNCSFMDNEEMDTEEHDHNNDDFEIEEFAIHENEMNDSVYAADCGYIDAALYDNLLDILEERGIGSDFAKDLVKFASVYEHSQYISLLEKLKAFAK
jgi:hypothetical protein